MAGTGGGHQRRQAIITAAALGLADHEPAVQCPPDGADACCTALDPVITSVTFT